MKILLKSTLLNSILLVTQLIRSRGQTEEVVELNGPLIQLANYEQILNKRSSSEEVSLGFSYLTIEQPDENANYYEPKYVEVDLIFEPSEKENESHYPILKKLDIFSNEINEFDFVELEDSNKYFKSSFTRSLTFEKNKLLQKLNNQVSIGVINYEMDQIKTRILESNDWNCNYSQGNITIDESFSFQNVSNYLDKEKENTFFGVTFDGGLPRNVSKRIDF